MMKNKALSNWPENVIKLPVDLMIVWAEAISILLTRRSQLNRTTDHR